MEARAGIRGVNAFGRTGRTRPCPYPSCAYRPMPFVVDDHGDARVAFAVAGLVHADRREAAERDGIDAFNRSATLWAASSGGAPRDVRKTAYGLLVRDAHRPRARSDSEIACGPAARLGPRHGSDHDAAHRRPGHARGASFRIGSIGAYPHVDAPGSRARVRNAAANP